MSKTLLIFKQENRKDKNYGCHVAEWLDELHWESNYKQIWKQILGC